MISQRIILSSHDHQDKHFNYFGALDSLDYKPSKIKKLIYTNRLENLSNLNSIFLVSFKKIKSDLQNQNEIDDLEVKKKKLIELLCSLKNKICSKKFLLHDTVDLNSNLLLLDLSNKIVIYKLE